MSTILARKPIKTIRIDMGTVTLTADTWVELVTAANMAGYPASAIEVFNGSASAIELGQGAAGSEVTLGYTIPPGGGTTVAPVAVKQGVRLAAKAITTAPTSGWLIINLFG